ncbi:hypothetical protein [Tritonibacter scottomollicae]|uniref:hypothetical protein n=1 Tax=Tritonibacter scottomollicae TaxID=483013 RepID=UPI003AA9D2BF
MKMFLPTLLIGALATMAYTVSPAVAAEAKNEAEKAKKPKKITDRRHPDYVRCRSEAVIGSLTRKKRICMTNAEWAEYTRTGSRDAKQFVEDMQAGLNTSN